MDRPVLYSKERKLSYTFLAAEALWIIDGKESVSSIAPYNKHIAQFSDDGVTFYGAYGPRVVGQFDYVLGALKQDRETRQAVMTTWRQNPPKTKDVPCTVALSFMIRDDALDCHVFMRSSDAWLGLPYDVFNFSMIAAKIACFYNRERTPVCLGTLHLTAASSHLYEKNWADAKRCIGSKEVTLGVDHGTFDSLGRLVCHGNWGGIHESLTSCRDNTNSQWQSPWPIRPRML